MKKRCYKKKYGSTEVVKLVRKGKKLKVIEFVFCEICKAFHVTYKK